MDDRKPALGVDDDRDLIAELLAEALDALYDDPTEAKNRILHARTILLAPARSGGPETGSLAAWQMKRVSDFVLSNLASRLPIEETAQIVRLTPCYFSRAFSATAGVTYSEFVERARVDLAKRLLLARGISVSEVALACGLAEQSHFTRLFNRATGLPPARWRRQFGRIAAGRASGAGRRVDPVPAS